MVTAIHVDTRELPAPEPMETILRHLGDIRPGIYLEMRHRMRPQVLLNILKNNGFDYRIRENGEDIFVYIFRADDERTRQNVGVL